MNIDRYKGSGFRDSSIDRDALLAPSFYFPSVVLIEILFLMCISSLLITKQNLARTNRRDLFGLDTKVQSPPLASIRQEEIRELLSLLDHQGETDLAASVQRYMPWTYVAAACSILADWSHLLLRTPMVLEVVAKRLHPEPAYFCERPCRYHADRSSFQLSPYHCQISPGSVAFSCET